MSSREVVVLDTCTDEDVRRVSERIGRGDVVVFPTDTVYGIGCSAACACSVARVFSVKRRDATKALPVFAPDITRVLPWIDPTERSTARRLASAFWPGALTIVVDVTGSGLHTQPPPYGEASSIGFRVPCHAGLLRLLASGLLLAQTSLNESGEPVIERLDELRAATLLRQADLILDSRQLPEGRPSTIVRLTAGSWSMLREGAISPDDVTEALAQEASCDAT